MDTFACLPTLEKMRDHVLKVLCHREQLDPEQTPLRQGLITRSGRPCGLMFQVQGPRRVEARAVWAGDEDRILFYDSTGARFAVVRLSDAPDPLKLVG